MIIRRTVKFLLHKRDKDSPTAAVRMRVTLHGRKPIDFPTGTRASVRDWDAGTGRAGEGDPEASATNRELDIWKARADELFARYEILEKRVPTREEVRDIINDMAGRETNLTRTLPTPDTGAAQAFDAFIREQSLRNGWSAGTVKKFRTVKRHLTDFAPGVAMRDITEELLAAFMQHFTRLGYRNTTTRKYISCMGWFLRWAERKGLYEGNAARTFRPKMKGADGTQREVVYLTRGELGRLSALTFNACQRHLERVRDVFLFCCFTGLRYSDAAKLRRSDVKDTYIDVVTQKTADPLRIELNRHSSAILEKYREAKPDGGRALPVISNQKMNEYLKELGRMAGIDEPVRMVSFSGNRRQEEEFPKWALLTTHCARRTFVVTALQLGIPSEVIMKWTGHSDFHAMRPYVKIVDELKAREMARFDAL